MSAFSNKRAQLVDHAKASGLFSELAYEEEFGLFYMEDSKLGFALVMNPMAAADGSTVDQLSAALTQDWPSGSFLQMSLIASPDIDKIMQTQLGLRDDQLRLLFSTAQKRTEFLKSGTANPLGGPDLPLIKDFKVVVTAKVPCSNPPQSKEFKKVYDLKNSVMSALSSAGMQNTSMTARSYTRLMKTLLNWDEDASWRGAQDRHLHSEDMMLRDQFLDAENDMEITPSYVRLGGKYVTTLSVKQYPDYASLAVPSAYIADPRHGSRGLKRSFMITATAHFPDSESKRETMTQKRNWVIKQAQGPMLKFVPRLASQYYSFNTLFEALDDGDKPVDFSLTLTLFSDSEDEAIGEVSNAKTYYRTLGMQLMENRFFHLPIFLNALPFGADDQAMQTLQRYKTMATRHAVRFLPFIGDWKGTGTPMMTLVSRTGQLMSLDMFDSETNYNSVIAAQSGSGKSFFTNEIILSYLGAGNRVWTIDVGRSYEKLCSTLDGQFIVFSEDSDICLNPFDLIKNYEEEADMLVGLITAMAAPNEGLDDFQEPHLRRILKQGWDEHGNDLTIDIVSDLLIQEGRERAKEGIEMSYRITDIGEQLYPFTSKGEYGKWFNGKNNLQMDNRFVVLELEELKGKQILQQVVLLQLIYQIQQEMYLGERDIRKLLIVDEAWALISSGSVGSFIETGYRRFRKYNGSATIITQSINDLYASDAGVAIAENSANMYLLRQKGQTIDSVKRDGRLPLSSAGYDLLKTVTTQAGRYSEIFCITERGAGLGRLIVNRFQQILYSTKPDEVQAVLEKEREGVTTDAAIEAVVRDEQEAEKRHKKVLEEA